MPTPRKPWESKRMPSVRSPKRSVEKARSAVPVLKLRVRMVVIAAEEVAAVVWPVPVMAWLVVEAPSIWKVKRAAEEVATDSFVRKSWSAVAPAEVCTTWRRVEGVVVPMPTLRAPAA